MDRGGRIGRSRLITTFQSALDELLDRRYEADYSDHFWWYHRDLRQRAMVLRTVRECLDNFALARFNPEGKVVLDAGCGFGVACLLLSLTGVREVHGIDVIGHKVETFKKLAARWPHGEIVHAKVADVRDTGYDSNCFDFVQSIEAISHYAEIEPFLAEAWRILKPGGVLLISDGNNGANPVCARGTQEVWNRFEEGPAGPIPNTGHVVLKPHRERRADIIRQIAPELSSDEIEALVAGTFAYLAPQIEEAVRAYQQAGALPTSHFGPGMAPREPSGQYIERLIYPKDLERSLLAAGFRARVYAYFGGAGGNPVVRAVNKAVVALSPLSWPLGRGLKAVCRKPRS